MSERPDHSLSKPRHLEWPFRDGDPHQASRTAAAISADPLRPTVFFFCRLGDMVMLTALLDRLHRRYHLPSHVIGAGSWNAAIYQGNPDVASVSSFGRHLPFLLDPQWLQVRRALRESDPGPIYICEEHYRQLPRIRRMLRLSGVNPARCVFLTDEPRTGLEHLIDRLMRLGGRTPAALRASDYPVPTTTQGPRLYVSDGERAERDAWLKAQGWFNRPRILIQVGNHRTMSRRRARWRRRGADDKAWPVERWVALLQKIHARMPEALILLRGSKEEVPMLREIQAATRIDAVAAAGQGLREFFALCDGAHSMISVDTGPAHAAAALSLPLVVLHGIHAPLHWGPRSPSGTPVLGVRAGPTATRVDQIEVDAVFDTWCSLSEQSEVSSARG